MPGPEAGAGRPGVGAAGRGIAGVAGDGLACCFSRCSTSWRGGTTGRAAGCPAKVGRCAAGRGAIGAPGVKPVLAGRGGSGRAGPGIGDPGVTPADAEGAAGAAGAPGATTCVGTCGILAVIGAVGAAGVAGRVPGLTAGRAGRSGAGALRAGSAGSGLAASDGGIGVAGPTRGVCGGSGRAGIAMFRLPPPCPGDANGGWIAVPPPNGGRKGLNVGAGRCSVCSAPDA